MKYNQVETGTTKTAAVRDGGSLPAVFLASADNLSSLLPPASDASTTFAVAKPWLRQGGYSRTALAALEAERTSPPRLGSLTQDLATSEMPQPNIELVEAVEPAPIDYGVHPPRAIAILSSPVMAEIPKAKTTVNTSQIVSRIPAPTMNDVKAQFPMAVSANLDQAHGSRHRTKQHGGDYRCTSSDEDRALRRNGCRLPQRARRCPEPFDGDQCVAW